MWYILLAGFVIWIFSKSSNGSSSSTKVEQIDPKYLDRSIDTTKTLFERNKDIIDTFEEKVSASSYHSYYIENETRDCVNEIANAENKVKISPRNTYLSDWRRSAPQDWNDLSKQIEGTLRNRQEALRSLEKKVVDTTTTLSDLIKNKTRPTDIQILEERKAVAGKPICIEDIKEILTPTKIAWFEKEDSIISLKETPRPFPLFSSNIYLSSVHRLNDRIKSYNDELEKETEQYKQNKIVFEKMRTGYRQKSHDDVVNRISYIVNSIKLPLSFPKFWEVDFDQEQGIVIVEIALPDIVHNPVFKKVSLKTGVVNKPLNQKETKELVPSIQPAVMLRTAYEVFRNDREDIIKLLVINGWVEYDDPSTGVMTKTYTASLAVEKDKIIGLNLEKLEPLTAFLNLKGRSAGKLIDIIPVSPMLSLDRKDRRFIETKEVLGKLDNQTNLASMDWQDFENLIAELFRKEFSEEGTEVKLTQSSRDKGVDAIVINPDPIRGGKYVIQAKRYTNTVDVSAVRDLVAVVAHEGASRGILVTTSTFGADAYAFVQNKPITLLDGAKLLGLLEKHNYKFRINLSEARKINLTN